MVNVLIYGRVGGDRGSACALLAAQGETTLDLISLPIDIVEGEGSSIAETNLDRACQAAHQLFQQMVRELNPAYGSEVVCDGKRQWKFNLMSETGAVLLECTNRHVWSLCQSYGKKLCPPTLYIREKQPIMVKIPEGREKCFRGEDLLGMDEAVWPITRLASETIQYLSQFLDFLHKPVPPEKEDDDFSVPSEGSCALPDWKQTALIVAARTAHLSAEVTRSAIQAARTSRLSHRVREMAVSSLAGAGRLAYRELASRAGVSIL